MGGGAGGAGGDGGDDGGERCAKLWPSARPGFKSCRKDLAAAATTGFKRTAFAQSTIPAQSCSPSMLSCAPEGLCCGLAKASTPRSQDSARARDSRALLVKEEVARQVLASRDTSTHLPPPLIT